MYICYTCRKPVSGWEIQRIMKNRLKEFMDHKKLSAADLADTIGVQRSNVSHILNGRNYPGAQFMEKLLLAYPDLDAGWLLTGKGEMIRGGFGDLVRPGKAIPPPATDGLAVPLSEEAAKPEVSAGKQDPGKPLPAKKIERVVIFYQDRTFVDYFPG